MKALKSKILTGVATIVTTCTFAYIERGYFALGADFLVALGVIAWLFYEVREYLRHRNEEYRRAMDYIQTAKKKISDLESGKENMRMALTQTQKEYLEIEKKYNSMMNFVEELGRISCK